VLSILPSFLPSEIAPLTRKHLLLCAQSIKQISNYDSSKQAAVVTTYVRQGNGGTPILLLHGFDSFCIRVSSFNPITALKMKRGQLILLGLGLQTISRNFR
jgi:hypothetical protein